MNEADKKRLAEIEARQRGATMLSVFYPSAIEPTKDRNKSIINFRLDEWERDFLGYAYEDVVWLLVKLKAETKRADIAEKALELACSHLGYASRKLSYCPHVDPYDDDICNNYYSDCEKCWLDYCKKAAKL